MLGRAFAIAAILSALAISKERVMAAPPPPDFAKAVTFIFLADQHGNLRTNPQTNAPLANGTGFFVLVPNENGPGGYGYLVTAKHVLKDEQSRFFPRVFIRINNKNSGSEFLAANLLTDGPNQNLFVHSDPTVDIAVIPAWPDETKFDFRAVPMDMIKTKEAFKQTTIAPGSDVFFAGLFVPHVGDKVNTPIFRFGRVAMLPDDRIRWQTDPNKAPELVELYLLETMSFGGNSGSPVFFSQGADRQPGSIILGPPEITLAGVMSGSFNEPRPGNFIQTPNAVLPVFAQNIGIAAVVPSHLLRDILYSPKLKQLRDTNPIRQPEPAK